MKYGYARVSTKDQNIEPQVKALTDYGCEILRQEKISGKGTEEREELNLLLEFIRSGDELVVTKIDRLARSLRDLENMVFDFNQQKVSLVVLETPMGKIETNTAIGKAFFSFTGVFAEYEVNQSSERQAVGIANAKANGVYKGRKPTIDDELKEKIINDSENGMKKTEIATNYQISRATVYRIIKGNPYAFKDFEVQETGFYRPLKNEKSPS
mgnify:CR=1 FL=1|tara:strand:+ start:12833 stop:13468 length:636 start_codon:yes stop_codon:yes gene_type:complete